MFKLNEITKRDLLAFLSGAASATIAIAVIVSIVMSLFGAQITSHYAPQPTFVPQPTFADQPTFAPQPTFLIQPTFTFTPTNTATNTPTSTPTKTATMTSTLIGGSAMLTGIPVTTVGTVTSSIATPGDNCDLNKGTAYRSWIEYSSGDNATLKATKCFVLIPNAQKSYGDYIEGSTPPTWQWTITLDTQGVATTSFGVNKSTLDFGACWNVGEANSYFTIRCFVPRTPTNTPTMTPTTTATATP